MIVLAVLQSVCFLQQSFTPVYDRSYFCFVRDFSFFSFLFTPILYVFVSLKLSIILFFMFIVFDYLYQTFLLFYCVTNSGSEIISKQENLLIKIIKGKNCI